ncbi:MAG: endosialidase [Lachnospiraceae bacterium]|nr:endosialidase [Lachnospiraceae bacterium]
MAYVEEVLRSEENGKVSFGNHSLPSKTKVENFKVGNDILKCKSFKEMTRLEKNDLFVYESEPGTSVFNFAETDKGVSFDVCADEDVQITLGLCEDTEYSVYIDDVNTGKMKTNLSGKLSISVELSSNKTASVKIVK